MFGLETCNCYNTIKRGLSGFRTLPVGPGSAPSSGSLMKPSFSSHSNCSAVGRAGSTSLSAQGCLFWSVQGPPASPSSSPPSAGRACASPRSPFPVFLRFVAAEPVKTLAPATQPWSVACTLMPNLSLQWAFCQTVPRLVLKAA